MQATVSSGQGLPSGPGPPTCSDRPDRVIPASAPIARQAAQRQGHRRVLHEGTNHQPSLSKQERHMKIAVINFSGNVGKTTIARHLLLPRIPGAELIAIESINADENHDGQSLRGRQFGELQEYMQTVDSVIVDIGASN